MVSGNILQAQAWCCWVLATMRSHFVTFELCHLLAHVFYINLLLSMSPSKINKLMLVVTIRGGHFMNSGIYSCAVDAFLEICFYHMYQIYILGMSLETCFSLFVHIIKSWGSYSEHYL